MLLGRSSESAGQTLIEMLVVLVILTVVLAVSAPRLVTLSHGRGDVDPVGVQRFVARARATAASTGTTVTLSWDAGTRMLRSSAGDSIAVVARLKPLVANGEREAGMAAAGGNPVRITISPSGRTQGTGFAVLVNDQISWRLVLDPWTGNSHVSH